MNINNMNLIKIPVGYSKEDKKFYISEFMRVFPLNEKKFVADSWDRHYNAGVLLIILDTDSGNTIAALRLSTNSSSYWELHANFIKQVPNIKDFKPEETESYNNKRENNKNKNTISYNIDEILDLISIKGYEKLSEDQKEFLRKQSDK